VSSGDNNVPWHPVWKQLDYWLYWGYLSVIWYKNLLFFHTYEYSMNNSSVVLSLYNIIINNLHYLLIEYIPILPLLTLFLNLAFTSTVFRSRYRKYLFSTQYTYSVRICLVIPNRWLASYAIISCYVRLS